MVPNIDHQHFETEERLMAGLEMPAVELNAHVHAHTQIIEGLTEIYYASMFGLRVPFEEIIKRVSAYVNEHIIEYDLCLKVYIPESVKGTPTLQFEAVAQT